jgi:phytoene dehydrogenase-like protein
MSIAPEVIVVGGGLAGLAAARTLTSKGVPTLLLESTAELGGRVATDTVDGFLLDRGFQVLLDSYPEAQRALDLSSLDLRAFESGALVHRAGRLARVSDPWRDPVAGVSSLMSGLFTPADAWRMLRLRHDAFATARRPDAPSTVTTAQALANRGFSDRAVEGFFRPFFGGVFLDAGLEPPRHWFEFLFAMFAKGRATLPAAGMRAIPHQLAAALPAGTVRLSSAVRAARAGHVELASGERFTPRAVILATDARAFSALSGGAAPAWSGCVTLYYAAAQSPVGARLLVLNGDPGTGPVNHVCVPSDVAPSYAPQGAHLVSATVIGSSTLDDAALDRAARPQLAGWFGGEAVRDWRLLRASRVPYALPRVAARTPDDRAVRLTDGLYACGDHLETPSINGALRSGRRAAEALLADWSSRSNAVA